MTEPATEDDDDDGQHARTCTEERRRRRLRLGLVTTASLYTFLFVGAIFGWGPMQLLLERNGSFSWKCGGGGYHGGGGGQDGAESGAETSGSSRGTCPSQSSSLVNVQFYATTTQILSPLLGQVADRYGAKVLAYLMAGCSWAGLALLTAAASQRNNGDDNSDRAARTWDNMLYGAFALVALSTWMGGLLTVQAGMYFRGHARSRVIFVLNSLFDAGSITYLGLWAVGEGTGADLSVISGGYLGLSVITFGIGLYFWTVAEPEEEKDGASQVDPTVRVEDEVFERPGEDPGSLGGNYAHDDMMTIGPNEQPSVADSVQTVDAAEGADNDIEEATKCGASISTREKSVTPRQSSVSFREDSLRGNSVKEAAARAVVPSSGGAAWQEDDDAAAIDDTGYVIVAERTLGQQFLSKPFLLVTVIWSIQVLANMWTLTTTREFLASLGDDEVGNKYLNIFTFLLPASIVAVPFTDVIIRRLGFHGGFQGINALALGYNLVRLLGKTLNVQILGFVLFSFFRSFFFGVTFSFLPSFLSPTVVGKLSGVLFAITGLLTFANVPLASYAIEQQGGNFFVPNLIYTILVVPCILAAWGIGQFIKQEQATKEAKLRASYGGVLLRQSENRGIRNE